ncbi:MAG: hypothetical protein L6422_00835 [Candidatus Marinimicrobia bacterium]|nr:hypothetical protein [bacterium]MCG2714824.1 hypothetical protein [Candidatus Neomarinimicrobiota bacterium]
MKPLYFDIRDIFRAPRLALSGKKTWVHLVGLAMGWAIYLILSYLALIINGQSITEIWNAHFLFPCFWNVNLPIAWYAWVIYCVGILSWVIIFMLASLAVSRITYKQLKGDEFFSSGDSYEYVKKHGTAVIMGPVSILLIMVFFIVMAIIAAWIAKWPVLDILFLGLPYLLYFVVAVFVVYTAVVFIISLILAPSIVGNAEEDTMETVFQSYSTLWAQPWRLVLYEAVICALGLVATYIYAYIMIFSYRFFNLVFGQSWLMGGKLSRISEQASSYIFGINSPLTPFISRIFNIYTPASLGIVKPLYLTTTDVITIVLITVALFVIGGTVLAYLLTNFSIGQSLIYVILRKKKDDENLVERKDEDELEEEEKEESDKVSDVSEPEETETEDEETKSKE